MRTLAVACTAAVAWLSSTVDAAIVDAETLTSVTVDAPLYDTNLGDDNGCDPAGCVGDLTRDGDLASLGSRWACKPALGPAGSTCSISFSLGESLNLKGLNIALYKGDTRTRTLDIYIDNVFSKAWTSSGTTSSFESVSVDATGQTIELRGDLSDSEWLSIFEVEILVDDGDDSDVVEAGAMGTVTATAALYDTEGCDPSGCTASLTRDSDLVETSRWSCAPKLGGPCTISYDLGATRELSELRLAMYKGTERTRTMEVYVDGVLVTTWTSSGTTDGFESIDISGTSGEVIEVKGVLTNSQWLSIIEVEIMVLSDGEAPAPAPTGDLTVVGRIPLAGGGGSNLDRYSVKDGDFSTSWTCTGGPSDPDSFTHDCTITFDLFSYRHIKQIKIALADGTDREMEMSISASSSGDLFAKSVTSSGTTDEFETYDFDFFTNTVTISALFSSEGESIAISEVEFLEEVQPGELSVAYFRGPYSTGSVANGVTKDAFEWISDSDEALESPLAFYFNSFALVTAIEMKFPVGETYKFDLERYDSYDGKPISTVTDWESSDTAEWQTFDLQRYSFAGYSMVGMRVIMRGTGSGAPGFQLLDARFIGTAVDNLTDSYKVGSTFIESWYSYRNHRYPDFVGDGSGDQEEIMAAICGVKKASFDGIDCVGEDSSATGTVDMFMGDWRVDSNIFMKSGVHLKGRFSGDDSPYSTNVILEEGAAGKTDIGPILVMDDIADAQISDIWIRGLYDPETSNSSPAVEGLGSTCLSVINSQNIICSYTEVQFCDGNGIVVRGSQMVDIDAGQYDDLYTPWSLESSRGTGLVVDMSDSVRVRRYAMYDNGVAGIHISGSNNFTFEATIGTDYGQSEGDGKIGSLDGQQPIDLIIESSSLVTFQDMRVQSDNEPVMTISSDSSAVVFNNLGLSSVSSGTCVIQTEDPSVVTAEDDELDLVGTCFVKV